MTGFGRQHRLLNAKQFQHVLAQKRSIYLRYFSVHAANNSTHCPRVGITVSRKVSNKAVQRNRIKRQIRYSFRMNKQQLHARDFVVIAKRGCADASNKSISKELQSLWVKANNK